MIRKEAVSDEAAFFLHVRIVWLLWIIWLLAVSLLAVSLGERLGVWLLAHTHSGIDGLGASAFAAEVISRECPAVGACPGADDLALSSALAAEVEVID